MIRHNNPAIDFRALEQRILACSNPLREADMLKKRRADRVARTEVTAEAALSRHRTILTILNRAEILNRPRTQLPRSLGALGFLKRRGGRTLLRAFNFLFRTERELSHAQNLLLRELVFQNSVALKRVVELERQLREIRGERERR